MNLRTLNGWQRLWLVLSAILALPIGFITYSANLPMNSDILDRLVSQGSANIFEIVALEESLLNGQSIAATEDEINNLKRGRSAKIVSLVMFVRSAEIEKELKNQASEQVVKLDPARIENLGRQVNRQHVLDVAKFIALAFISWLLISAAIYFLGWVTGWVLAGFRKQ